LHVSTQLFLDYARIMRAFERKSYPLKISASTLQGYWITLGIIAAYFVLIVAAWLGIKLLSIRVTRPATQST